MVERKLNYYDSLYGAISYEGDLANLIASPVLQRMRHVRLSNIDSIAMPGIANLSRYEHVLGVGHLARQVGFSNQIPKLERVALESAALLHDWIITAFGHLVEEGFKYLNTGFDHELRMKELLSGEEAIGEIGFIDRQILGGRQTNLRPWAKGVAGEQGSDLLLQHIMEMIQGKGRFGKLISGEMDLDNIDNVYRIAYHMGLQVDRELPLRLAQSIMGVGASGEPLFVRSAEPDIVTWLQTRSDVYSRLMPAEPDFGLKLMIISATIDVLKSQEIGSSDWHMTDTEFVTLLLSSKVPSARETAQRWLAGEVWNTVPLRWISGARPGYPEMLKFSEIASKELNRSCLAYGIKDKRNRVVKVEFDDGTKCSFGRKPNSWLFGLGSPKRQPFSATETKYVMSLVPQFFGGEVLDSPTDMFSRGTLQKDSECLI